MEVKTGLLPDPIAPVQLLNYLAASRLEVGLVLQFGADLQIKRLVRSSEERHNWQNAASLNDIIK